MLVPSGRSNSDVHPLQTLTRKSQFLQRNSSPQLSGLSGINKRENGHAAAAGALSPVPPPASTPLTAPPPPAHTISPNKVNTTISTTTSNSSNNSNTLTASEGHVAGEAAKMSISAGSSGGDSGTDRFAAYRAYFERNLQSEGPESGSGHAGNWQEIDRHLHTIQLKLKEGWTVHVGKDGRLYYCNHVTQTSGWLPSCEDWSKREELPYGWERAVDSKGRAYYINHLNKSSTYEVPECVRWDEHPPEPRLALLQRSPTLGFGFVAGSERPVIVRFVTDGGPSMGKLQPGDQILAVNGEDVKDAPRDHVIQLVRACETQVTLLVCQPMHNLAPGRKSTLLSAGKRAKLRTRPSRVRFAESVCVNGAPLFPPSAFSLGDICVPPMANVLKVFLENGQTKSFKYDATTTVQDVVTSLLDKLCLSTPELFSLVLEHVKSLKRNKLTLLDPDESLARIAARPGAHKLRCLFRVTFVPISAAELAQKDLNALDYLYMQCCNDVTQERFAPELQPEVALRLAALHMHQHALANNVSPTKLTVKVVEREFGLERFVPVSLFDGMKRKELRRLISHFLKLNAEMTGSSTKVLTQLQAKLHYLDIIASLPSYGAKCFSTNQREGVERVLLVSPRFGLSQISSARNSVPQPLSAIEDFIQVVVQREDDVSCLVSIFMTGDRAVKFSMEDRDACEFSLVLAGYYRLLAGKPLPVAREREEYDEDNAPSYLTQHTVLPAAWSYLLPFHNRAHSVNFLLPPPYHPMKLAKAAVAGDDGIAMATVKLCDRNMNSANVVNSNKMAATMDLDMDIHSVMATELLEEAKDSGMSDSSGGGSSSHNYCEGSTRSGHAAASAAASASVAAFIEAKNEEVLRRVQEMQKMVESSEQYLTEQGEQLQDDDYNGRIGPASGWQRESGKGTGSGTATTTTTTTSTSCGVIEFDSDCDSLNSSKVSSTEDTPQPGVLKHSDSLVLLAEAINHDLTGITKGLNSIGGSHQELRVTTLSATSSPRPDRKFNGLGQLLSNLQALGADFSQSESDSESVNSPTNSPTMRRSLHLNTAPAGEAVNGSRKKNAAYRSSFGLHSPDGSNFGPETKDYNLREYLKQLKEISNVDVANQDTDMAAQKLSEIYGFEIREDTFIETDSDLIDLRAIPPPQTPDELDALSLLNAAPHGFDDGAVKRALDADGDLDKFLAKVVVAPPTQKATPAKELTPEEIMSFIIPPPPNLEEGEREREQGPGPTKATTTAPTNCSSNQIGQEPAECLYSNSLSEKRAIFERNIRAEQQANGHGHGNGKSQGHVIEYATVERKGKFSCCPKSRREISLDAAPAAPTHHLQLPPRAQTLDQPAPPARPPKSADLRQRCVPRLPASPAPAPASVSASGAEVEATEAGRPHEAQGSQPPSLPPRVSPSDRHDERGAASPQAPKKPPLPPLASRPMLRSTPHNGGPPPTQPRSHHPDAGAPEALFNGHANRSILCSPQMARKLPPGMATSPSPKPKPIALAPAPAPTAALAATPSPNSVHHHVLQRQNSSSSNPAGYGDKLIIKNGHVIDGDALLAKTDVAMAGLLVKLDQVAAQCSLAHTAGGGTNIDEEKFQRARNELTEQTLVLVTASKFLVVAMSDMTLAMLPEHLTSCLTAIRKITELTQDMTRHTSSPLQTRNIVLKVHDVASSFRELVGVEIGPLGAGQLALQAECLANVLATLLRSLRVFSP